MKGMPMHAFLQNQEDKVHDSAHSNACYSVNFPVSPSASCTPEDFVIFLIDGVTFGKASRT